MSQNILKPNSQDVRCPFKDHSSWQKLMSGVVFSEIYQVTGPVERFASNIASEGYVVALPSSFHEFEGPEAIPYDTDGTDRGNKYKVSLDYHVSYDTDSYRSRRQWKHMMRMRRSRSTSWSIIQIVMDGSHPLECV